MEMLNSINILEVYIMFENIGKKIKGLASVVFFVAIIGIYFIGINFLAEDVLFGIFIIIIYSFSSWLLSCVLYGFGELIDKVCEIKQNLCNANNEITENIS